MPELSKLNFTITRQMAITAGLVVAAFTVALPVGASMVPSASADDLSVVRTAAAPLTAAGECSAPETAATSTPIVKTSAVKTASHTHTVSQTGNNNQNGTNNSQNTGGATAQVGRDGVAVAVDDVLSHNNIPVLSNNTTTVSPVVSPTVNALNPTVNVLNSGAATGSNTGTTGVLGLGLLGVL